MRYEEKRDHNYFSLCGVSAGRRSGCDLLVCLSRHPFSGNLANFNLKEANCYIISGDKVIDSTTMTFEGLYRYSDGESNDWDYTFEIPGYTDIVEGEIVYDKCFATKIDKRWTAQYYVYRDNSEEGYYIQENQEPMIILIMDFVKNKPVARVYFAGYERLRHPGCLSSGSIIS